VRTRTWGAPAFGAVNGWVTVDQLRQEVETLASCKRFQPEALPVYLLDRSAFELRCDGRVIFVAGNVRRHVSDFELTTWQERLEPASIRLIVLNGDSHKCNPDAALIAETDVHLQRQAEVLRDAQSCSGKPPERRRQSSTSRSRLRCVAAVDFDRVGLVPRLRSVAAISSLPHLRVLQPSQALQWCWRWRVHSALVQSFLCQLECQPASFVSSLGMCRT
jgi:hypothetical protein